MREGKYLAMFLVVFALGLSAVGVGVILESNAIAYAGLAVIWANCMAAISVASVALWRSKS